MEPTDQSVLQVIVVEAKTATDIEKFTGQDPFVKISYENADGTQCFKTAVKNNAGRHAKWGTDAMKSNSFETPVLNFFARVDIVVFDHEKNGKHRQLGAAHLDYSALCINGGCD